MKERPILFSDEMVRAILEGRKTQTRRVVKFQPPNVEYRIGTCVSSTVRGEEGKHHWVHVVGNDYKDVSQPYFCNPYGTVGDRLIISKAIPGARDEYCAGSDGEIYSRHSNGWKRLKPYIHDSGFACVTTFSVDGRKQNSRVHRLVCSAFYGPAPKGSYQVRHLDGNLTNNRPDNLAWGTHEENWQDRRAHGNGVEGEKHHAAKFTDHERAHIRWALNRGFCSQRHAARLLGVSQGSISQILEGHELIETVQDVPVDRIPLITLEITGVRVERLQDISLPDTYAEGIRVAKGTPSFAELWDRINAKRAPWESNPWVWVVNFKRIEA